MIFIIFCVQSRLHIREGRLREGPVPIRLHVVGDDCWSSVPATADSRGTRLHSGPYRWAPLALRLGAEEHRLLTNGNVLNDTIVNALQCILHATFTTISGWQHPAVGASWETGVGFDSQAMFSVQILHTGAYHWVTAARLPCGVVVADSHFTEPSLSLRYQLVQLYGANREFIDVLFIPCQQQEGSVQCGDFAFLWALLFGKHYRLDEDQLCAAFANFAIDQSQLRSHIINTLRAGQLQPLGIHSTSVVPRQPPMPTTFRINCETKMYCSPGTFLLLL